MLPLPIDPILPAVIAAVQGAKAAVVTAAPGSGKSTRVPPALLGTVTGQIYLLQPRRIAAKTLARRIAQENGWTLGKEVGYRVRFEKVGGKDTRLWVMTEGSLTRQLADDPYLEGVGAVILDEFHERSLHTDLAMGYLRELQKTLRPDLALVVMSATLDATGVAAFLGDAPVLDAPGRTFPVTTRNAPFLPDTRLEQAVAQAVAEAAALDDAGDILVFLPGMGEIRWCQRAVEDLGLDRDVLPLHGSLPPEEQDRALAPSPRGKVVLSTNVAETSVTIPGVRTVIDTGTARVNRFNAATGLAGSGRLAPRP
jgi:ATP-dependent helicase HrpB